MLKTLGDPELMLNKSVEMHHLPHMALEVMAEGDTSKFENGDPVLFKGINIRVVATVFKPGGTRFLLKNFEVYYLKEQAEKESWFTRLKKLFKKEKKLPILVETDIKETVIECLLSPNQLARV